ncbi:glycosyltransferase family 2 protein [Candidatus Woesearchaeota archaeon]|nr:glycosyltransferase family 2 protein [Candidatus Woesearchaeota archaeon]
MLVSVVLPCRNEEETIGRCIKTIKEVFKRDKIEGEIIVSDSSTDKSYEIAKSLGVRVIKHNKIGYGNAYIEAFKHTKGKYVVMGDSDETYNFYDIPKFLKELRNYDLVIGDRFNGLIHKNAMDPLHRYLGNPLLGYTLRHFFKINVQDPHSGFRAIKKEKLDRLNLKANGMEFASEMIIKAHKNGLKIKEIPINYYPRKGRSKLNPFRDGWRHLRLMLLYSPDYLFLVPGLLLFLFGSIFTSALLFGPINLFGIILDIHPMILSSLLTILGYQIILLGLYAKTYAVIHLKEKDELVNLINKYINLERGSLVGLLIISIGVIMGIKIFYIWSRTNFGALDQIRPAIFILTLIVIGIQTIFSSFLLSILGLEQE